MIKVLQPLHEVTPEDPNQPANTADQQVPHTVVAQDPQTQASPSQASDIPPVPNISTGIYPDAPADHVDPRTLEEPKEKTKPKTLLTYGLIAGLLLGAGFVIVTVLTGNSYKTVQVRAPTFTYYIYFAKNGKQATLGNISILKGKDLHSANGITVTVGPAVESNYDCHASAGSTVTVIATPTIDDGPHSICYSSTLNAYAANFTHDGKWYFSSLTPQDGKSKIGSDTAKEVLGSIHVK